MAQNRDTLLTRSDARERIEEESSYTVKLTDDVEVIVSIADDDLVRIDFSVDGGYEDSFFTLPESRRDSRAYDPSRARDVADKFALLGATDSTDIDSYRPYNDIACAINACADIVQERDADGA